MPTRRILLPAAATAATVLALTSTPTAHATGRVSRHGGAASHPVANRAPSATFVHRCRGVANRPGPQRRCARAAKRSFNRARAAEGLGPLSLPHDFARMRPETQLLTITNIERVDRGLRPAAGLARPLNRLARRGARHRGDPPLSGHGTSAAANWAGVGRSTLLADYIWMYDDGAGSGNADCGSSCWGHRANTLSHYARPLRLGAAWRKDRYYGASIATEWVGGDRRDRVTGPRWRSVRARIPLGLRQHRIRFRHGSRVRSLELWASGRGFRVRLRPVHATSWSLARYHLRLRPGQVRFVRISYHPGSAGHHTGLIRVIAGGEVHEVRLVGG